MNERQPSSGSREIGRSLDLRALAARFLLVLTILVGLGIYLLGWTSPYNDSEVPVGESVFVFAHPAELKNASLAVDFNYTSGPTGELSLEIWCQQFTGVPLEVYTSDGIAASETRQCPASGEIDMTLNLALSEGHIRTDASSGLSLMDVSLETFDGNQDTSSSVDITAILSWSEHFATAFGSGVIEHPRSARWGGEDSLRASATFSPLVVGPAFSRISEIFLLLLGALFGFALSQTVVQSRSLKRESADLFVATRGAENGVSSLRSGNVAFTRDRAWVRKS